jgi:hypothetical protein
MKIEDYHITYCTNIHPGQDWNETFSNLKKYLPAIKAKVAEDQPFGLGLRLSNTASEELNRGTALTDFKQWLDDHQLYVFTMNGFPYGNFHHERVKDQVHAPDWTTPERLEYTLRLFDQLNYLLPEGMDGGISTSPISYRHWFSTEDAKHQAFMRGAGQMALVALHLYGIKKASNTYLHLDIEPEPDGLLENTSDVLHFYDQYLLPIGVPKLQEALGVTENEAREIILYHITLCYDICHFSLAYEEPEETFSAMEKAGIKIGKIQVSAALKILNEGDQRFVWETLERFNEPVYLHQVTEKKGNKVITHSDLPEVLKRREPFKELRAHFHVPIFVEQFEMLHSTQDHILKVLNILREKNITHHLEIETYTWEVLPGSLKKELGSSIIRELEWLKKRLTS